MRRLILAVLLLSPLASHAADQCQYSAPRDLTLDLAGVREVQVELHSHDLHLSGSEGSKGALTGKACASDPKLLDALTVTQHREGDRLVVDIGGNEHNHFSIGYSYTDLKVDMQLPTQLPVVLNVGSGDAWVSNLQRLSTKVGSGDVHISKISGPVALSVGSGDIDVNDVVSLDVGSVGSGDLKINGVRNDARIGSIGSGDIGIRNVGGSVRVDTLGSGDLVVHDVQGDFTLGAKGSGDVSHSGIKGKVNVPHDRDDD
jgi:hypothetical protein